jgi:hypothetical protein
MKEVRHDSKVERKDREIERKDNEVERKDNEVERKIEMLKKLYYEDKLLSPKTFERKMNLLIPKQ